MVQNYIKLLRKASMEFKDIPWKDVLLDTKDFVEGNKRWGMIFQEQYNSSAATYYLVPDEQTYS